MQTSSLILHVKRRDEEETIMDQLTFRERVNGVALIFVKETNEAKY
jgi:hypothetical protein